MSWIILALTLGASITSIIHGVFMLFGSLSVSGGAVFGIPSTMLASLPVISAIFALIGGIMAFNRSKWGAIFLFIAGGLCVPSRDTWLYGGLYFLAGVLCFLLPSKKHDEFQDMAYENEYDDENSYPENEFDEQANSEREEFYYVQGDPLNNNPDTAVNNINAHIFNDDVDPVINSEPPKLRRRMSKICPECGAIVSRENRFCPTCGTKLFVFADEHVEERSEGIQNVNETLFTPADTATPEMNNSESLDNVNAINNNDNDSTKFNVNDGDEMSSAQAVPNYRVLVKPQRNSRYNMSNNDPDEAVSSYQEFSKYSRRAKKRKRSAGRKVLSILLLVSAVGGALYFLLGLRKLPPGDLPPMVRPEVINIADNNNSARQNQPTTVVNDSSVAEPVNVAVTENLLPNFTPERNPSTGMVIGSNVNVRADHSTSSNRITRLSVNSKIEIIGTYNVTSGQYQGIWYNIRTGGREGWIYGRYVQPLGSGIPSGYSNALLNSFGDNKSEIIETLGNPTRSSNTSLEWAGLTATLKGDDITRLRLTGANRELQNGLKVGMSQTALLPIMGYPSGVSNRIMQYNEGSKTGLSVQLDKNNAISSITVNQIP